MSKCGAYSKLKNATDDSKNVIKNVFGKLVEIENLKTLNLENTLNDHKYKLQVVAGVNYYFEVLHDDSTHSFNVWKKLDGTFEVNNYKNN